MDKKKKGRMKRLKRDIKGDRDRDSEREKEIDR